MSIDQVEPQDSYPVMVEVTEYRLVWVEADNAEEAAQYVSDAPSEYLEGNQPYDFDFSATAPGDELDWGHIYGWRGAAGNNDAHVQTHQRVMHELDLAARRKIHAEAGHPDQESSTTLPDGRRYCMACGEYFTPAAAEAVTAR